MLSTFTPLGWAPGLAELGLAVFVILQLPDAPRMARIHLSVGLAFAVAAMALLAEPLPALHEAAGRAAFIAVVFSALGTLRAAAQGAAWVGRAARMLVRQPPGRRYWAIAAGGTLFGAIINFGAVPLLAGMIQDASGREARGPGERSMMVALLRGFSVVRFWCPTTMAYAVATATLPGAAWPAMAAVGTAAAVAILAAGRFLDRRAGHGGAAAEAPAGFEFGKLAPLLGLLTLILALAAAIETATGARMIDGVILVAPPLTLGWLVLAQGAAGPGRLVARVVREVPAQRGEILVLANAAFVGMIVAALAPPALVEGVLTAIPPALIAPPALTLVVAIGQLGVNPLVTVTALSATLAEAPALGGSPTLIAAAMVMARGLAVGSSPGAAATLIVGRFAGRSSAEIGLRWNGAHTRTAVALISALLAGLHALG